MATKKFYAGVGAFVTWFAVIGQLVLIIQNRVVGVPETLVRFFTFFTILTNIIVAIVFTAEALSKNAAASFWRRPSTQTAVLVYITVVGITYNVILRQIWAPQGMQRVVDELLHLLVPLLYFFFWIIFVPKEKIAWRKSINWLLYPFVYLLVILAAGNQSGYYPYPFVDVNKIGYEKVLINCAGILGLLLVLSLIFIAWSHYTAQKKSTELA